MEWIYTFVAIFMATAAIVLGLAFRKEDRRNLLVVVAAGLVLTIGGLGVLSYPIAHSLSRASTVGGYGQKINYLVKDFRVDRTVCEKRKQDYGGSNCVHTDEKCDPYTVNKGTDDEETKYWDCPYGSTEYTYIFIDERDHEQVVADHIFGSDTRHIYGLFMPKVPRGLPDGWQQTVERVKAKDYPSGSRQDTYDNVRLGYQADQRADAADDIKALLKLGLLPKDMSYPVHDGYLVDKVKFVGMDPPSNAAVWQDYMMRASTALGVMPTHGDMYITAIPASKLPPGMDPDSYNRAYAAHWLSDFSKLATYPKNAIAVILGVSDDGQSVLWARGSTGMGKGNETMLEAINLRISNHNPPVPFDPEAVLGKTIPHLEHEKDGLRPHFDLGKGIVMQIVMVEFTFDRECMRCQDANEKDKVGYAALEQYIPISTGGIVGAILVMLFVSALLTAVSIGFYSYRTGASTRFGARRRW